MSTLGGFMILLGMFKVEVWWWRWFIERSSSPCEVVALFGGTGGT